MPDIRERIAAGDRLGTDVEHRNYIDGVDNLDYWTGKTDESARDEYLYYAESRLQAIRINQWKARFFVRDDHAAEDVTAQRCHGSARTTHGDSAEIPAEAEGQQPEPRELRPHGRSQTSWRWPSTGGARLSSHGG